MQRSNDITDLNTLDSTCQRCKLRNLCSVDILSVSERKRFSDVTVHGERCGRGQHLFYPDDQPNYIYIIHSGSFKLYITNANGDIQITGFYFQGDVLALDIPDHLIRNYGAVALEASSVCKIQLAEYEKLVSRYPALLNVFLKIMGREIMLKQRMMLVINKMTAEQKVADFLVHMSAVSGSQGYSPAVFKISMLRLDIANYLGIAVETVSRIFKSFKSKGIIHIELRRVSINNLRALKSLAQCDDTETKTNIKAMSLSQK